MSIYTVLDDRDKTLLEDKIKESSEQFNIKTAEGKHVVINDSADFSFMGMKLYGKTTQVTTTGKNLFDYETHKANGYTSTINVIGGKTLYRNGQVSEMSRYTLYDSNGDSLGTFLDFDFTKNNPLILPDNASYIIVTDIGDEYISTLYIGYDSDTTFEKYTGLQPSPSPQYEQPLESVGKWGNLASNENIMSYSDDFDTSEKNATLDKPYTGYLSIALYPISGTSQVNVRFYYADGTNGNDNGVLSSSGANNTWHNTNIYVENVIGIKLYNVDASNVRTLGKLLVRYGSYSSVSDSDYRPYTGQLEVESGVYGKNLFDYSFVEQAGNGITQTWLEDKSILLSGTTTSLTFVYVGEFTPEKGKNYILSGCPSGGSLQTYTLYDDTQKIYDFGEKGADIVGDGITRRLYIRIAIGVNMNGLVFKPMIRLNYINDATYEPYKPKQSHISLVGDGLKGIPVTDASLATYTNEKGKFICADEKNYARSLNIERVHRITKNDFTGSVQFNTTVGKYTQWTINAGNTKLTKAIDKTTSNGSAMCNILPLGWEIRESSNLDEFWLFKPNGIDTCTVVLVLNNEKYPNADAVTELLDDIEILFVDGTEIETPLTADEIASYKALKSNYKITSVMNDCEAEMEIKYAHEVYDEGLGDVVKKVVESETDGIYLKEAGESYAVSVSVASSYTQTVVEEAVKKLYSVIKAGWFGNALISVTCTDATLWFIGTLRKSSVDPTLTGIMMRYGANVNPTEYQIYYNDDGKEAKVSDKVTLFGQAVNLSTYCDDEMVWFRIYKNQTDFYQLTVKSGNLKVVRTIDGSTTELISLGS